MNKKERYNIIMNTLNDVTDDPRGRFRIDYLRFKLGNYKKILKAAVELKIIIDLSEHNFVKNKVFKITKTITIDDVDRIYQQMRQNRQKETCYKTTSIRVAPIKNTKRAVIIGGYCSGIMNSNANWDKVEQMIKDYHDELIATGR